MHCIDEERKIFIQKYNKKIERERRRLKGIDINIYNFFFGNSNNNKIKIVSYFFSIFVQSYIFLSILDLLEKTKTFVRCYANRCITNHRKRVCCKSQNVSKLPRKLTTQYKQDEKSKTNATYFKNTGSKKKLQKRKNNLQRGKNKQ